MDYLAIADALALRFASTNVTPPSGLKTITTSTARPPNAIPNTPFVIAWPDNGDVTTQPGQRSGEHEFKVSFYYSKSEADIPREYVALLKWLGVLIGQLDGQMKLGIVGVLKALVMKWEIGVLTYAGNSYEGITFTVHVWTQETVTLVP
jgi:hypothetical protein